MALSGRMAFLQRPMDYNDIRMSIPKLRVVDLKEALKSCNGLRSGNKPDLVKRCESMLAEPRHREAIAKKLHELLRSSGLTYLSMVSSETIAPLAFPESPFLTSVQELSPVTRLNKGVVRQVGGSRVFRFKIGEQQWNSLSMSRLYVRGGEVNETNDIAYKYPRLIRWYMNGKMIKEATHTRFGCVDVTDLLTHRGPQDVVIELIQPSKATPVEPAVYDKFALQLIIAKLAKVEDLLPTVTNHTPTEKECFDKVKAYLKKDQDDTDGLGDISFGLMVVPLHCPVSQLRMSYPSRGKDCNHLHCFDAQFYLQMNSRKSAWLCPICNRHTPLESLRIDSWLKKVILDSHPEAVEIELNNDGTWKSKALDDPDKETPRKRPRRTEREDSQSEKSRFRPTDPYSTALTATNSGDDIDHFIRSLTDTYDINNYPRSQQQLNPSHIPPQQQQQQQHLPQSQFQAPPYFPSRSNYNNNNNLLPSSERSYNQPPPYSMPSSLQQSLQQPGQFTRSDQGMGFTFSTLPDLPNALNSSNGTNSASVGAGNLTLGHDSFNPNIFFVGAGNEAEPICLFDSDEDF